ncbi:MAG: AarF/UbiB family protein, partial [Bdellovibrionales bacterium]
LDAALDDAFSPIPEAVKVTVPLDSINSESSKSAVSNLAQHPIDDDLNIEYKKQGLFLTLALWSGAHNQLKNLLTNIVKQLYSDTDSRNFRFLVNSDPTPSINARAVDFNSETRRRLQQVEDIAFERWKAQASPIEKLAKNAPREPRKVEVPVNPGVEITITAGLLASVVNVDELAGQIAKSLARLNPVRYGYKEDTRFTRNQEIIDIISGIVDQAQGTDANEVRRQRTEILAEISAMERLAIGGFNPMSMYYFEQRELSWMTDVFEKSSNHALSRKILGGNQFEKDAWSRPFRLQLQQLYMTFLQSTGRVDRKLLANKPFESNLMYLRLRMKLYTKPFFAGVALQSIPLIATGGAIITSLFFPEVANWALSALDSTSNDSKSIIEEAVKSHPEATVIGQFTEKISSVTHELLQSHLFQTVHEGASASYRFVVDHYLIALGITGSLITYKLIAQFAPDISRSLFIAIKQMEEKQRPNSSTLSDEKADPKGDSQVTLNRGELLSQYLRLKTSGAKDSLEILSQRSQALSDRNKQRWLFLLEKGKRVSQKASKQVQSAFVTSWKTSARMVRALPSATASASSGAVRVGIKITRGVGKGIGVSSHFIFIDAPVFVGSVGYSGIVKSLEYFKEKRFQHELRAERRRQALDEKATRIMKGQERLGYILNSQEVSANEVYVLLKSIFNVFSNHRRHDDTIGLETVGFEKVPRKAKAQEVYLSLINKWLEISKKAPPTEYSLYEFINLLDSIYTSSWYHSHADRSLFNVAFDGFYDIWLKSNIENPYYIFQNSLLKDLATRRASLEAKEKGGSAISEVLTRSSDTVLFDVFTSSIRGNEKKILEWVLDKETSIDSISDFASKLRSALSRPISIFFENAPKKSKHDFELAIRSLSLQQRVKLLYLDKQIAEFGPSTYQTTFSAVLNEKSLQILNAAPGELVRHWGNNSADIASLEALIQKDCKEHSIDPLFLKNWLYPLVFSRPNLITRISDVELLFTKEHFWSNPDRYSQSTPLEAPLVELLNIKKKQFGDVPAWKYDPKASEKIHNSVTLRLKHLGIYPKDFVGMEKLWKFFTSRGVSTVSDELLSDLLKIASPDQAIYLEEYGSKGHIFDQGLSDEFAIREIKRSIAYRRILSLANEREKDRSSEIRELILVAQSKLADLGIRYSDFLEETSNLIQTNFEEAQIFEEARGKRLANMAQTHANTPRDTRLSMFKNILPHIKSWKAQQQKEFLLYLRGGESTPFIEAQFPTFGPERIRKIYQGLPFEQAQFIASMYLSETLLARNQSTEKGVAKELLEALVKQGGEASTQRYVNLLLRGLLHGIEKADSSHYKLSVVSAMVAMKVDKNASIGETLKKILEQFPGVGPKIGQFLVATGKLPDDINTVLRTTQDDTIRRRRFDIFQDLIQIINRGTNLDIQLDEYAGGGSIKYTNKGKMKKSNTPYVLQVFREDVQNNVDIQIEILNHAIDFLVREGGPEFAFLQVVVDGAMNAVLRERRYAREATKTAVARQLYAGFGDADFTVRVPEQFGINKRLLLSRFADGKSFFKLADADQVISGIKILEMESKILFGESTKAIWYDTDRHAGNILIQVEQKEGRKHTTIWPIDFGQLTSITPQQRQKVTELFALSALMGNLGSNDWLVERLAKTVGVPSQLISTLKSNLAKQFPGRSSAQDGSAVTDYFSLLAAINLTVKHAPLNILSGDLRKGKIDFAYVDFVRAIIQLNQYEVQLGDRLPKTLMTPRRLLESRTKDHLAQLLQEVPLSLRQSMKIRLKNILLWREAQKAGSKFVPFNFRLTREELEQFEFMETRAKPTNGAGQC